MQKPSTTTLIVEACGKPSYTTEQKAAPYATSKIKTGHRAKVFGLDIEAIYHGALAVIGTATGVVVLICLCKARS